MKSIKLKNDNYFDSSGIVHNQELLSTILSNIKDNKSNYMKLENGTLICWGATNRYNINPSSSEEESINLPFTYKNTNYVCITSFAGGGAYWANGVVSRGDIISTSKVKIIIANYLSNGAIAQNVSFFWLTIGKWK